MIAVSSWRSGEARGVTRAIWAIIVGSLSIHIFFIISSKTFWHEVFWSHEPFHTGLEISGSLTAIAVGMILLSLEKRGSGTSYNIWISGALLGMGILDGFHSLVHVGPVFVWLHSTATFFGGLLFMMVWLPESFRQKSTASWCWLVTIASVLFCMMSLLFPQWLPPMVQNVNGVKEFTYWAKGLNVVGGVLFLLAGIRIVMTYSKTKNIDDLLFFLHCALFGTAAIMFEQSKLWDTAWWGWHVLRFFAYGVALWFVILTDLRLRKNFENNIETKQFREVLEAAPIGMVMVNRFGKMLLINKSIEEQFNYSREELIEKPISLILKDSSLLFHSGSHNSPYKGLSDYSPQKKIETEGLRKDNNSFPVELSLKPIITTTGLKIIVLILNISERKQASAKLEKNQAALLESNQKLTEFNNLMVGRELKMIDLKKEINALSEELGRGSLYNLSELESKNA